MHKYQRHNPKLKVLVIVKNIDGGTGTFLIDLLKLNKIAKNIIEIKTLALEHPSFRTYTISNIEFVRAKNSYPQKYSLSPFNFINFIYELIWINEYLLTFSPNIVMGVDLRCNLLAILTKLFFKHKIKTIVTTHVDLASLTLNISGGIVRYFLKTSIHFFYEKTDALVCVSKNLSSHLKKDFAIQKDIQTIYCGRKFTDHKPRLFPNNKKIIILSVARLSQQKDYDTLIRAFKLFKSDCQNSELWIAGDGPEKQRLKKQVEVFQLTKDVKFLGWVKNTNTIYNRSDIFVLSSKFEGFGYVLIEAMSNGLPIISTNSPYGPSEVLAGGKYGILVPIGNEKLMKKSMFDLIRSKSYYEYFSSLSLERSKYFSEYKMLNSYRNIFENVLEK
ncbi:MAG TPA: glycosyltransferase [Candidatus Saccharimonadales bacterium]|nr:glycosyltransferase [Candidatus Saccharimonadales bacterium]